MDIYDAGIYLAYLLLIVGIGAAIILPLISTIKNPKDFLKTGLGIGALLLLFVLAYVLSSPDVAAKYTQHPFYITEGTAKLIGGGLIMTYLLGIIALGAVIIGEVRKIFK